MNRALIATLLLSSLALPVFAADAIESAVGGDCPTRKLRAGEPAAASDPQTGGETAPRANANSGGEAAASPPRIRPRWQSFLPGMIR